MKKTAKIFLPLMCTALLLSGCGQAKTTDEKLTITVKDLTPPVIKVLKKNPEIIVGTKFSFKGVVEVYDNMTKTPKVTISGDKINTKKAGTYKLKITAIDADGNEASDSITVTVKEKPEPTPIPTPTPSATPTPEAETPAQSNTNNNQSTQQQTPVYTQPQQPAQSQQQAQQNQQQQQTQQNTEPETPNYVPDPNEKTPVPGEPDTSQNNQSDSSSWSVEPGGNCNGGTKVENIDGKLVVVLC